MNPRPKKNRRYAIYNLVNKHKDGIINKLTEIALRDPFIRLIAGFVVVAIVASYAVSKMQTGVNTVLGIALTVAGGVVLFILRTLMKYSNSYFVKMVSFASSAVIMLVFLVFVVLLVPVITNCWPQPYADLFNLPRCTSMVERPFEARLPPGLTVASNPENGKYHIFVFYRLTRQEDAEYIVGALLQAGYDTTAVVSSLNEVIAPDKRPGTSLVKTTTLARPIVDEVAGIVRRAIPPRRDYVSVFPSDAPLQRGNIQVDLF